MSVAYDYRRGQRHQVHESNTNVLYLLGTAADGPVMEPLKITNEEDLLKAFGTKGSIPNAWTLIKQSDPTCEIFGCKVVGLHSKCHLDFNVIGGEVLEDAIEIAAIGASQVYDQIEVVIGEDYIEFNSPDVLGGRSYRYMFSDYPVVGLLMRRINYDAENGNGLVFMNTDLHPNTELFGGLYPVNPYTQKLYGGYDGVNCSKEELYFGLQDAYDMLESVNISVIVPVDCRFDDLHPDYLVKNGDGTTSACWVPGKQYLNYVGENGPVSYHRQLIDFCKKQIEYGIPTIGIMGFAPIDNLTLKREQNMFYIYEYIYGTALPNEVGFSKYDPTNPSGQDGRYLGIIYGDILYNNGIIENGYLTVAAMLASSYTNVSLTNMEVKNVQLATEFTTEELDFLDEKGFTSFRISPLKGLVISNAVSATSQNSEYHYLCNTRMTQIFLAKVHEGLQYFVGEIITDLRKDKAIEAKIDDIIALAKDEGIIKDVIYTVNYDSDSVEIAFDIKALYMIESVKAYKEA